MHDMLTNYGKIYAPHHKEARELQNGVTVIYQEKIDGSQFSFARTHAGELVCRSKRVPINIHAAGMFEPAVRGVGNLDLVPGWVYRAEAVCRPKHNHLTYDTVPPACVVLFEVVDRDGITLNPDELYAHALDLGVLSTPTTNIMPFHRDEIDWLNKRQSRLGGCLREGTVVRCVDLWDPRQAGQHLRVKYVRPEFKEEQKKGWKKENPTPEDFVNQVGVRYRSEARWAKAVQHMAESGRLAGTMADVGPLLAEIQADIASEEKVAILDQAWTYLTKTKRVGRLWVQGFPEWYRARLEKENSE